MKSVKSNVVYRIQLYVKKNDLRWKEGIEEWQAKDVKYKQKLKPKFYWIEAKSYIFHEHNSMNYYCITKTYFDAL